MSDSLSLRTSIAGLINLGAKVSSQLYQLIDSGCSAPDDVQALARELQGLCSLLQKLENTLSKNTRNEIFWVALEDVLNSCREKFRQIEALAETYKVEAEDGFFFQKWKQLRWSFQEKEVTTLRSQLEAHKMTLNITLLFSAHIEKSPAKEASEKIETTLHDVITKLDDDADQSSATGKKGANYTLQRYLSNASAAYFTRSAARLPTGDCSKTTISEVDLDTEVPPAYEERVHQSLHNPEDTPIDVPSQPKEQQIPEGGIPTDVPDKAEPPQTPERGDELIVRSVVGPVVGLKECETKEEEGQYDQPRLQPKLPIEEPKHTQIPPEDPSIPDSHQTKASLAQNLCSYCRTPVQVDDKFVWNGGVMHGKCLRCTCCHKNTCIDTPESQEFVSPYPRRCETRGLFCVRHDPDLLAPMCFSCKKNGRLRESSEVVLMKHLVKGNVVKMSKVRLMDFLCSQTAHVEPPPMEWYVDLTDEDVDLRECLLYARHG